MEKCVSILFFSDSHLGFDTPLRPRIKRRRRGCDFQRNFISILDHAIRRKVNAVVHGGDLFYRSRIPPELTAETFNCLSRLATAGIPLLIVPGNHERSKIPNPLLAIRPQIHLFSVPGVFSLHLNGIRIAFGGFPFQKDIRRHFAGLFHQTALSSASADFRFLCMHQAVEGATVGINNFTFRYGPDVIPMSAIPADIDAVLSGHIHRAQVLWTGKRSDALQNVPVIFAGSIERTAFTERNEKKGFFILTTTINPNGEKSLRWTFHSLPTRPMIVIELRDRDIGNQTIIDTIIKRLPGIPYDAVLQIRYYPDGKNHRHVPSILDLRSASPDTMNISFRVVQ